MKNTILIVCGFLSIAANSYCTETVFGPSTIRVGTNEAILLTTITSHNGGDGVTILVDGFEVKEQGLGAFSDPVVYAIAGSHNVVVTNTDDGDLNDFYVTFQRLTNSPIKTILLLVSGTNTIDIPTGRTIQMFPPMGGEYPHVTIQPRNSTNWFRCFGGSMFPSFAYPSITGPATVRVICGPIPDNNEDPIALSYYFTDEVFQFPPPGSLGLPAPILQVNIEKSYDLTNWTPKAVFHTDAEAKAFYRLKMLK